MKVNFSGFDADFKMGSKQVRFGFDSGSKLQIRIRFVFEILGFDTALGSTKYLEDKIGTRY